MIRLTNTHSAHTYTLHSGMKQPVYNSNIKFSYLIALYTEVTHETNVLMKHLINMLPMSEQSVIIQLKLYDDKTTPQV